MEKIGEIITRTYNIPYTELSFTANPDTILKTWAVMAFIFILVVLLKGRLSQIPHRRQAFLEGILGWFDNVLKESMGEDGRKFLPFLVTLFLFVLVCNWMSTLPGLTGPTRDLNLPLGLAILVFFVAHISAIKKKGIVKYIKGYFEPFWFLFPSNIFSEISKVLSHSFRLYGNIFAGGVIISLVPFLLGQLNKWIGLPIGIPINAALTAFFALFLGGIQAFVFALLAVAYIAVLRG